MESMNCSPLDSNISLETSEESANELSTCSTSTCTSLSLTAESERESAEADKTRPRKRCIRRKRPSGLKYRKGLIHTHRLRFPLVEGAETARADADAAEVDGVFNNSKHPQEDQSPREESYVYNADDEDEDGLCTESFECISGSVSSTSESERRSSTDFDELSSLSSFLSVSSDSLSSEDDMDFQHSESSEEEMDSLHSELRNGHATDRSASVENEKMDGLRDFMKDPLYEGAHLSVFECCTLLMLFVIKHKLTKAALQDLLYLIQTVIPSIGCKMLTSIYRVNGLFSDFFGNKGPSLHYMCGNCGKLLKPGKTQCGASRACKQARTVKFAELNVEEKLQEFFLGKIFLSDLFEFLESCVL